MRRETLYALVVLLAFGVFLLWLGPISIARETIIPCTTDTDCAEKNPQFCGQFGEPVC
jgi:hypothetical protein